MSTPSAPLPLLLTDKAAMQLLGVRATKFYRLKRSGVLDECRSPIDGYWSRALLERFAARPARRVRRVA